MMNIYDFRLPQHVRFGVGARTTVVEEARRLGGRSAALISDEGLLSAGVVDEMKHELEKEGLEIVVFAELAGEPSFIQLEKTTSFVKERQVDLVIGLGGGSAMDIAKTAAALTNVEDPAAYLSGEKVIGKGGLPCILLPTTSGTGSEVTMNAIFSDDKQGVKRGLVSPNLLPTIAVIDPALTLSCPPKVSAATGVDAFTHALESFISTRANPMTKMYSYEAMKRFADHIHGAVHNGRDLNSRIEMSYVSYFAGVGLANAGVGAVHALAYPLGGSYHVEHGVANALLMPYVFDVIGVTCKKEMVDVAHALQLGDYSEMPHVALKAVTTYLKQLLYDLNLPVSLKELGIPQEALATLARQAIEVKRLLHNTPYRLTEKQIVAIYQKAYIG